MNGTTAVRRTALVEIPFRAEVNSAVDTARRHTLRWLQHFGLLDGQAVEEYDALHLERLMARFYPDASAAELCLACDVNGWFFVFDDQFDGHAGRRPEVVAPLVECLVGILRAETSRPGQRTVRPGAAARGTTGPEAPLVAAFRELWERATDGMPTAWCRRFGEHWRAYLEAHRWEAAGRTALDTPSLERFLTVRRHTIGVRPCLDFAERCGGRVLPEGLYGSHTLTTLRELTVDVVIFVNDLVSLDKELAAGDVRGNSVLLLRSRTSCTLEDATAHISSLTNSRVARFRRVAAGFARSLDGAKAPSGVRRDAAGCLRTMRHLMSGNLAWSLETARYDASGVAAVSDGRSRPWAGLDRGRSPVRREHCT